jgi:endonuclease YncB( thermonuclease family)
MRLAYLVLCVVAFAVPASAAGVPQGSVQGRASVVDGDTLDLHGERIRLFGVDAPESAQTCADAKGTEWRCGQRAALALSDRIGTAVLTCTRVDRDQYGRTVAKCRARDQDINAWLVESGWAVAYRAYGKDYDGQEQKARAAGRGVWQGAFTLPWEWRAGRRKPAATAASASPPPAGCTIKGNRNAKGECLYHLPGSRDYARTVITAAKGERYFCTAEAALAAGCRAAR